MILEFKSTLPGGSGERMMARDLEETFGSMTVEEVLITVASRFLLEDVQRAFAEGKCLDVDFSESKTHYDCSEVILERAVNYLSEQGQLRIVNAKRVKKGRKKAVLTMRLVGVS